MDYVIKLRPKFLILGPPLPQILLMNPWMSVFTCDDNVDIVDEDMYDQGVGGHHIQRGEEDEIVSQDSKAKVIPRLGNRQLYSVIHVCMWIRNC